MAQPQNTSIFSADLMGSAIRDSFVKLDPRQLIRNPVMFTTATVAVLATVLLVRSILSGGDVAFEGQIVFWLWLTVLFGNFAESLAEGRGQGASRVAAFHKSGTERQADQR